MSPRSVEDVGSAVVGLAERVGAAVPPEFTPDAWHAWLTTMLTPRWYEAFVAVWRRPWMSLAADTYGSSLLDLLGVGNVFADSVERYPNVTLDEVATLAPNLIVLPSEPYPFAERHLVEIEREVPGVPTVLIDGRDLFWWGIRTPAAAERLRDALPGLRTPARLTRVSSRLPGAPLRAAARGSRRRRRERGRGRVAIDRREAQLRGLVDRDDVHVCVRHLVADDQHADAPRVEGRVPARGR